VKNLELHTYLSQLLEKPLLILLLSPEYTFLVVPSLAYIYFTINVILNLKASVLIMVGDGAIWLPYFDSATLSLWRLPIFFTGKEVIPTSLILGS